MKRDIDGVYFRVKRGDKYENICWSDLTKEERDLVSYGRDKEWFKKMLYLITDTLQDMAEQFDIVGGKSE